MCAHASAAAPAAFGFLHFALYGVGARVGEQTVPCMYACILWRRKQFMISAAVDLVIVRWAYEISNYTDTIKRVGLSSVFIPSECSKALTRRWKINHGNKRKKTTPILVWQN